MKSIRPTFIQVYIMQVDRMMSGKNPVNAMGYIRDLGLFNLVFEFPQKSDPPVIDRHDRYVLPLICNYIRCVEYMQLCLTHLTSDFCTWYRFSI